MPTNSLETESRGEDVYRCPRCTRLYRYKSSMLRHFNLECGKEPQFNCPYCPVKLTQKSYVRVHVKRKHAHLEASALTSTRRALARKPEGGASQCWLDACTAAESYACTDCGRRYQHRRSLWRHRKLECGKVPQYQCPLCPRRTTRNSSLKKHVELFLVLPCPVAVVGSRDVAARAYHCLKCGRCFHWKSNLMRHRNSVCGSSLFDCPVCRYSANRKDNLLRHIIFKHPEIAPQPR
ncbi:zinc finger protein 771-like [Bacillus rossius redtenbacheri]|uniref:zinc finger protein 771-like n=1 Tax=Bacillus rossius redtenbacheri TaxID=93214 RepID=UPI002FDCFE2B